MDYLASVLETASGGISKAVRYLTGNEAERAAMDASDMAAAQHRADAYNRQLQNYTQPSHMNITGQLLSGMPIPEGESQVFPVRYFGGPVDANNPYIVGDGVDMRQAELFVPEVNGRIMNNRELQDLVMGGLTDTQNNSTMENNLEREYLDIIETKKKTLATLQNLKKYAKNKMNDDKLNQARDVSGA